MKRTYHYTMRTVSSEEFTVEAETKTIVKPFFRIKRHCEILMPYAIWLMMRLKWNKNGTYFADSSKS